MRDQFGYFAFQNVAHFICFLYGSATMVPDKQVVYMVYLRGYIVILAKHLGHFSIPRFALFEFKFNVAS